MRLTRQPRRSAPELRNRLGGSGNARTARYAGQMGHPASDGLPGWGLPGPGGGAAASPRRGNSAACPARSATGIGRQGTLPEDDWWSLHTSVYSGMHRWRGGGRLPDKLLRLGVRFADGTKATTIEQHQCQAPASGDPPPGPLLSWQPGSSGMHGRQLGFSGFGLWLWPLPAAETFEFAVEWPFAGIELTIVDLDGTDIVAAARRSTPYWPETEEGTGRGGR